MANIAFLTRRLGRGKIVSFSLCDSVGNGLLRWRLCTRFVDTIYLNKTKFFFNFFLKSSIFLKGSILIYKLLTINAYNTMSSFEWILWVTLWCTLTSVLKMTDEYQRRAAIIVCLRSGRSLQISKLLLNSQGRLSIESPHNSAPSRKMKRLQLLRWRLTAESESRGPTKTLGSLAKTLARHRRERSDFIVAPVATRFLSPI